MSAIETKLNYLLERLLALLLFSIFAAIVLLVVLRYVFNTTIVGGNEGALVAFVYTTALGGALAAAKQEHIAIHYFVDLMPAGIQQFLEYSSVGCLWRSSTSRLSGTRSSGLQGLVDF